MWSAKALTFFVIPEKKPATHRAEKTNAVKCECGAFMGTGLESTEDTARGVCKKSGNQTVPWDALGSPLQLPPLPCAGDDGGGCHRKFVHEDTLSPTVVSLCPVALKNDFVLCGLPQGNGAFEPGFSRLCLFCIVTMVLFSDSKGPSLGNLEIMESLEKKLSMTSLTHYKVIMAPCLPALSSH